jgi:alkylation response protein AidB-like acyl-CoA dehydrogenase
MDLNFSPEETAFRDEVRRFVGESLPPAIRHKVMSGTALAREEHVQWQRILHARGWGGVGWPSEFGGPGWSPAELYIFEEECAMGGAPRLISFGLKMIAPVLMAFGTPAQQQRFLPKIMAAEEWWCQGYSEPGAGSDLASLKTRAQLVTSADGDYYVVNGQKTWTTLGPARRLDLLPGAHRSRGEETKRHILPADRHEIARRHRASDHHPGRRPRSQ